MLYLSNIGLLLEIEDFSFHHDRRDATPQAGRRHPALGRRSSTSEYSKLGRRQFITNRTARTQDNKNVGRKPVTHWHRREREKKRERERNLKGRKRREGGHGSAEARTAEGQAEM
jgi:hypothetical protein